MNNFIWMILVYLGFGVALLGYGIWGLRSARNTDSERTHALGMHAAGFGIPCGLLSLGAAISWVLIYAYR